MTHHYSDADTSAILCMFPDTKRVAYRMQDWVDNKVVSVSGWLYNEWLVADILRCLDWYIFSNWKPKHKKCLLPGQ